MEYVGDSTGHERTESSCVGAATNRPPHCWTSQQTNKLRVSAFLAHTLYSHQPQCCTYGITIITPHHCLHRFAFHFAPTHAPLLHSLGGSLPFIRPNSSDLLALFPLSKLTITKFPTCHVCLCYTIMVSVFCIWIAFKFEKQLVDKTKT